MDRTSGTRAEAGAGGSLTVAVVEATAERAGVDPTDLDRPLYDVIDPDALEELFPSDSDGRPACRGHVSFEYGDFHVEVTSDREVRVRDREAVGGERGRRWIR